MPEVQVRESDCAESLDPWNDRADPENVPALADSAGPRAMPAAASVLARSMGRPATPERNRVAFAELQLAHERVAASVSAAARRDRGRKDHLEHHEGRCLYTNVSGVQAASSSRVPSSPQGPYLYDTEGARLLATHSVPVADRGDLFEDL